MRDWPYLSFFSSIRITLSSRIFSVIDSTSSGVTCFLIKSSIFKVLRKFVYAQPLVFFVTRKRIKININLFVFNIIFPHRIAKMPCNTLAGVCRKRFFFGIGIIYHRYKPYIHNIKSKRGEYSKQSEVVLFIIDTICVYQDFRYEKSLPNNENRIA